MLLETMLGLCGADRKAYRPGSASLVTVKPSNTPPKSSAVTVKYECVAAR